MEEDIKIKWFRLSFLIIGCLFMAIKAFVPAASPYMPGSVLLILILLIMGGVVLCAGLNRFLIYFKSSLLLFLIPILSLLQSLIIGNGNAFSIFVSIMMLMVWPVFSSFLLEFQNDKRIVKTSKILLLCISALLILTMVTTYNGNLLYPGASRDLAHFEEDKTGLLPLYINMNIGGFGFIYTITLVFPLLAYWMKTNALTFIMGIATFILAVLCIMASQYTIALLMLLISIVLCFFPRKIKRYYIYIFIAILLFLIILGPWLANFFLYLSDAVEGKMLSARLYEIYQILSGSGVEMDSDTVGRVELIRKSWNTFADNFIIGSSEGLGDHSYIVDNLARFGVMGLVAMIISFRCLYKQYISKLKNSELYYYALASYLINLVQCYFNTYNGLVVFTLILPLYQVAFRTNYSFNHSGNE